MSGIWRTGLAAATLAGVAVLVMACSSDPAGTTTAGAAPSASSTATAAQSGSQTFSECMRTHGVPNFPDKNSSGGYAIPPSIDVNSATYQNAFSACSHLRNGGAGTNSVSPQYLAKEVRFSQCMRAHGVSDFPDPNSHGGFSGSSSMSPQSPTWQNAVATCSRETGLNMGSGSSS